jgi:plasmid stabilization system protein ParE
MSTELEQLRARITELAGECARLAHREADLMFDCGAERARAEAAEALVGELRKVLEAVSRRAPIMGSTGDYREGQKDALQAVREQAAFALAKTPADMGGCPHSCVDGGEHAKVCAELARLREQIAEDVGVKTVNQMLRQQLTEAENQALGGQDLVDALRARVAELEAELGDSRLSGSLIAKECGEAQARVDQLERDKARLDWLAQTTNGVSFEFESRLPVVSWSAAFPRFTGADLRAAIDAAIAKEDAS